MARAVAKAANTVNPRRLLGNSGVVDFLDPGGRVTRNLAEGGALTARNILDPANVVLHAPPAPPPPAPVFPDVAGAQLNARRNVRRRAITSGVGSTVLTGGYSPTGQASPVLGGG